MSTTTVACTPGLDPSLPDVSLILGGKEYHLCFDFNAIALAEEATGVDLMAGLIACPSAIKLRGLLWASLVKGSPEITIEQVGALVTMQNMPVIWKALQTAWFGSNDSGLDVKPGEVEAQAAPAA